MYIDHVLSESKRLATLAENSYKSLTKALEEMYPFLEQQELLDFMLFTTNLGDVAEQYKRVSDILRGRGKAPAEMRPHQVDLAARDAEYIVKKMFYDLEERAYLPLNFTEFMYGLKRLKSSQRRYIKDLTAYCEQTFETKRAHA